MKVSRNTICEELFATANRLGVDIAKEKEELFEINKKQFEECYKIPITAFPNVKKAGEFSIDKTENVLFPLLNLKYENGVPKSGNSATYVLSVDGQIVKIGYDCNGPKGNSIAQYKTGVTGTPSSRNTGVYLFILNMLEMGKTVEIYYVESKQVSAEINTISGTIVKNNCRLSAKDIETASIEEVKRIYGIVPILNLKEQNKKWPDPSYQIYLMVLCRRNYYDEVKTVA